MSKLIDELGNKYGALTVIEKTKNSSGRTVWLCECECGNQTLALGSDLRKGKKTTCGQKGCLAKKERNKDKVINEIGNIYTYLTVLERAENDKQGRAQWLCQCKCGNTTIVSGVELRQGHVKSCGCYQKDKMTETFLKDITGQTIGNFTVLRIAREKSDNRTIKWKCRCNLCGNEEVYASASNLKKQQSCGCLHESKGSVKIKELLQINNIDFIQEKRFSNLSFENGYKARFDFYLPNYNTIIEYDGKQHFIQGNGVFDNEEKFTRTQEHDFIKNEYCKNNNITLIRIPYTHYDNISLEDLLPASSKFIIK